MNKKQVEIIKTLVANAPKWAKWLALDADGSTTYFSEKPRPVKDGKFWATQNLETEFENDCESRKGFEEIWEKTLTKINSNTKGKINE